LDRGCVCLDEGRALKDGLLLFASNLKFTGLHEQVAASGLSKHLEGPYVSRTCTLTTLALEGSPGAFFFLW
jgi:hypothetical protein